MNRKFEEWLKTFRDSINDYDYYTDFAKVYEHAEKLKPEIYLLNSLVGAENIERDFENLLAKYPACLKAIPILLAVRADEISCRDINYRFDKPAQSVEQYKYFMQETGLFELLKNRIVANLYDYVTGVEVGLDSNGRKNRGGLSQRNLSCRRGKNVWA